MEMDEHLMHRMKRLALIVSTCIGLLLLTGCHSTRPTAALDGADLERERWLTFQGRLSLDRIQAQNPMMQMDGNPLGLAANEHLWFSREAVSGGRGVGGGGCGCN